MTLDDRQLFFQLFFSGCLAITAKKGPDYNPEAIPLMDVLETAVDTDTEIQQVLWIYYRKHTSAVRRHTQKGQPLDSEDFMGRCHDSANYLAMMAFYDTHRQELHAAWRRYWVGQPCECVYDEESPVVPTRCQGCETLSWLERRAFAIGSTATSSRSTPRAQG